jgi:uncharacterized membrane-anchored protein YitT (DUF2179 family)
MKKQLLNKTSIFEYFLITVGSMLYGISTTLFIFPDGLLLGGTSGISVILTEFLPFSPGIILMVINFALIFLAFAILGRGMGIRTVVGSSFTALFVALFEEIFSLESAPVSNPFLSTVIGAVIIAIASGILFFVKANSGGTDIVALIVQKFSGIKIGRALLVTDILIVIVGGIISGWTILASSSLGLLVKALGIDLVIRLIKKFTHAEGAHT